MYTTDYYFKGSNNQRYANQRQRAHFNEKVILHATTAKITATKRYMNL